MRWDVAHRRRPVLKPFTHGSAYGRGAILRPLLHYYTKTAFSSLWCSYTYRERRLFFYVKSSCIRQSLQTGAGSFDDRHDADNKPCRAGTASISSGCRLCSGLYRRYAVWPPVVCTDICGSRYHRRDTVSGGALQSGDHIHFVPDRPCLWAFILQKGQCGPVSRRQSRRHTCPHIVAEVVYCSTGHFCHQTFRHYIFSVSYLWRT